MIPLDSFGTKLVVSEDQPPFPSRDITGRRPTSGQMEPETTVPIPFRRRKFSELTNLCKKVKSGEASEEERAKYELLFGVDSNCPGWKCYRYNFPYIWNMYQRRTLSEDFATARPKMLKLYAISHIHSWMVLSMASLFLQTPELLFEPDDDRVRPVEMACAAAFRQEVIWPLFGSVQNFWEPFYQAYFEVEKYCCCWPKGEPSISYPQLKAEFEAIGDDFGAKLAEILMILYGDEATIGRSMSFNFEELKDMF